MRDLLWTLECYTLNLVHLSICEHNNNNQTQTQTNSVWFFCGVNVTQTSSEQILIDPET